MTDATRIDKWLWSARMFKTRTAATSACLAGKVKLNGRGIKPSRAVVVGDTIQITRQHHRQTVEVRGLAVKRVAAKLVAGLYEDVTPIEELEREDQAQQMNTAFRQARGKAGGRPSKKDRRDMQKFRDRH